jgi:hypothetical protein
MDFGRLIRVTNNQADHSSVAYIVAVEDSGEALAVIRNITGPGDEIVDLGCVSNALLHSLDLCPGGTKVLGRPPHQQADAWICNDSV